MNAVDCRLESEDLGWRLNMEVECWKLEARLGCSLVNRLNTGYEVLEKEPGDCRCRLETEGWRLIVGDRRLETDG